MTDLILTLMERLPAGVEITLRRGAASETDGTAAVPAKALGHPSSTPDLKLLKEKEAAETVNLSLREVQRARKAGYLTFDKKRDGRDSGAILIHRDSLDRYVERREAIRTLREAAPDDWPGPGGGS